MQEFELSLMSEHFIKILNIHEQGNRKKWKVGYITGEQSEQGPSNTHAKKAKWTTLAFGSLKIQDTVMADANQINEHVAPK